jgi:hypothetical protein
MGWAVVPAGWANASISLRAIFFFGRQSFPLPDHPSLHLQVAEGVPAFSFRHANRGLQWVHLSRTHASPSWTVPAGQFVGIQENPLPKNPL